MEGINFRTLIYINKKLSLKLLWESSGIWIDCSWFSDKSSLQCLGEYWVEIAWQAPLFLVIQLGQTFQNTVRETSLSEIRPSQEEIHLSIHFQMDLQTKIFLASSSKLLWSTSEFLAQCFFDAYSIFIKLERMWAAKKCPNSWMPLEIC